MSITFPTSEHVGYVDDENGQPVEVRLWHGFCLPEDVVNLPTGIKFANGSDVTVIGGANVVHYDAENQEWTPFVEEGA